MRNARAGSLRLAVVLFASASLPGCLTLSANPKPNESAWTVELPGPPPGSPARAAAPTAAAAPKKGEPSTGNDRMLEILKPSGKAAVLDSSCDRQCDEQSRLCSNYRPGAMADCQQAARQCRESCVR